MLYNIDSDASIQREATLELPSSD